LQSIVMSMSVCGSVCLSAGISPEPHWRSLPNFLCMLPMSVAWSSSGMFMIGCIACRWEGVFFPIENALLAGKAGSSAQRGQSMLSTIALLIIDLSSHRCTQHFQLPFIYQVSYNAVPFAFYWTVVLVADPVFPAHSDCFPFLKC